MGLFSGLLKSAVRVVATPIAVVADVVALPFEDLGKEPFSRTEKTLEQAGKDFDQAFKDSSIL